MSARLFAVILAAFACHAGLAQDTPIATTTTTITVLTTPYAGGSVGVCAVFQAQSILSSISQSLNIGVTGGGELEPEK